MTHSLDNAAHAKIQKILQQWERTNAVLEQFDENFDKITDKLDKLEKIIKKLAVVLDDSEV